MKSSPAPPFPHPDSGLFFVTLRLSHALPESFSQQLGLQFYAWQQKTVLHPNRGELLHQLRKKLFKRFDETLDAGTYQKGLLDHPALAKLVQTKLEHWHAKHDCLLCSAVLPNHIHLLLQLDFPDESMPKLEGFDQVSFGPLRNLLSNLLDGLEKSIKNGLHQLGAPIDPRQFQIFPGKDAPAPDEPIWHPRSFDFMIRNAAEYEKILHYIRQNVSENAHLLITSFLTPYSSPVRN